MKTKLAFPFALLVAFATTADDFNGALQKGLFEEEANHDLDAAIKSYQSVLAVHEGQRKLAATALFRLGECYRKLGRTNDAVAQYQRLLRDFSDQSTLTKLSEESLATLGAALESARALSSSGPRPRPNTRQRSLILEEIKLAEEQLRQAQQRVKVGVAPVTGALIYERALLRLKRELAATEEPPGGTRQRELLQNEIKLQEQVVNAVKQALANGKEVAGNELIQQRELLELKRELAALDEAPGQAAVPSAGSPEDTEVRSIRALIKDSPDLINAKNGSATLLHKAARQGQLAVASFLLANGADVNLHVNSSSGDATPLHDAASSGRKSMVELLLASGAQANAQDQEGRTPLMVAVQAGFKNIVEVLLANGADVNAKDKAGDTALHRAVVEGSTNLVALLLQHAAAVNARNGHGETALHYVAKNGRLDVAAQLLAAKADPNLKDEAGFTPLHLAADRNFAAVIDVLLAAGAQVNLRSNNGTTALELAISRLKAETVEALLRGKADPNAEDANGWPPLYVAVSRQRADIVELLLEHGANPNRRIEKDNGYSSGMTALRKAASGNLPQVVALLLKHQADPNLKDDAGNTALHSAVLARNAAMVDNLLKHGAEFEVQNAEGESPLTLAARYADKDIVERLLKGGANPNARARDGLTPLHKAAYYNKKEVLEVLLAAKADPNAADNEGRTPLDYVTRDLRADVRPLPPRVLPPGAPVAIASTVRPKPVLSPRQSELANVLRKGGANEWAPRPGQITVARRGADVASPVFRKGTYDNQFTLFELLAASAADWPFPDYSRVTISRLNAATSKMEEIPLDVAGALAAGDCARDVPLRWGDLVDLPEREHGLNESSLGLPVEFAQALAKCLERTVKVTVKRQMKQLPLKVEPKEVARAAFPGGGRGGYSISSPDFWLSPVLRNSGLLLTSSDLSRVKVKRVDPATGDRREWVVDLDRLSAPNDLWLRDGDLVEVPEK